MRLAIFISGHGSNMRAILDAIDRGVLPATACLVLSNRKDAAGLSVARARGVETEVLEHRAYASREDYDRALLERVRAYGIDYVALAGFMRLLTDEFLIPMDNRTINIHPSLLPAFPGMHAQADALAYGVRVTGCTVHFVDRGTDTGPIILQTPVLVHDEDDEGTLSRRILEAEHELYPRALALIAEGRVKVTPPGPHGGRSRVTIHPHAAPPTPR